MAQKGKYIDHILCFRTVIQVIPGLEVASTWDCVSPVSVMDTAASVTQKQACAG